MTSKLKLFAVTTLALITAVSFLPQGASAAVAFNTFPISYTVQTNHDLPLLDGRNASVSGSAFSTSQADHDNGVQANAGDEVEFQIYYHNTGTSEDIAKNVTIRAALPGGTRQSHEVSASIDSDQTDPVTSGSRGGNMTVHINGQPQTLVFVPGSVRWFPNHSTTGQTVANGDSLMTASGLNIGDVRGCFEFSGFINFRAKVGAQQVTNNYGLDITKRVLNVTKNESTYQSSTSAAPGDRVRFEVKITTSGNAAQNNVIVRDTLPSQLTLVSASLQQNGSNAASAESEFFSSNGRNLGTLSPGATHTFVFDANVSGSITSATTLTNTAFVKSNQVAERQAQASVNVTVQTAANFDLGITKRVLNVTKNENSYQSSTNASPGDRVRFEVRVTTSGSGTQNNVIVRDILPTSQLNLVAGSLLLNGSNASNMEGDFLGSGRNIGSRSPGSTDVFVFDALVAGSGAFSGTVTTVTNTANVRSDQVGTRQAEARVNVQLAQNVQFQLRKTAFNLTQGVDGTSVPANPGNSIVYTLYFKNTGNTTLTGIVIEDNIQDILQLAQITDQGGAVSVNGSIKYSPVDIPAGVEVSRNFTVRVRPANEFPAGHDSVMVNVYGNEVRVLVRVPQVAAAVTTRPPRTGPGEWLMSLLAGFTTFGYFLYRKQKTA